ncbi:YfhO family protein [Halobacillus seohaensis]|uniref:YfhO family protein n=1 Tax=Halobacillus seohaensis TaxID=447421 RepID=A0ABW2ES08_9BACI
MNKKRDFLILIIASLTLAVLAHLFFLKEWIEGQYMVGPNDGLQQMVTFKKLLYEQYTSGSFFYSYSFGLGGGTYSQLAFYFSTSLVFILTTAVTFLLESLHLIGRPDIVFWAKAAVLISVCRMTLILCLTTYVFRYMKSRWLAAFVGASVYSLSVIYYRHVTYWEFFADAMIWVPLLVLGIEKIMREAKVGWFIFAVALTLFNNFYFAYVSFIFILIYFAFRLMIRLDANEVSRWRQFKLVVISGLTGSGISAVGFIPAIYSFLNNHRPAYSFPIEIVDFSDNILFTSRLVIVPALFLLFIFTFSLYKIVTFGLFALLSVFFILLHFSPLVASAFNGFSAPQYRWEYLLSFTIGGVVSIGLQYVNKISKKNVIIACIMVIATYLVFFFTDRTIEFISTESIGTFLIMILILTLVIGFIWRGNKTWYFCLHAGVLLTCIVIANLTQYVISEMGNVHKVSQSYLQSDDYNGEEQRNLLQKIEDRESSPFYRIDWKIGYLNNTPIVQDFNGMSVYSSILNRHLLFFYLYDLNINTGRESVSRYATLGSRANLYSLLQGKYMMKEKDDTAKIPYGFKEILKLENYVVYKNTNVLPFVRTTNQVYAEEDMEDANALEREQAMLEGVIVENMNPTANEIPDAPNILDKTSMEMVDASFENNKLSVSGKKGGIDLVINAPDKDTKDYYVSFHLENLAKSQGFALKVNDYRATRKHNQSLYKTNVDDLTIRVPKADKISIRVPKGEYILKDLKLFSESYTTLETAKKNATRTDQLNWKNNKLTINYNNQDNNRYMMLPIPYERGWQVRINNKKQPLEKVNYAFVGFPIKKGMNDIQLQYYPPFFKISLILTIVSTLLAILIIKRQRLRLFSQKRLNSKDTAKPKE